MKKKPNCNKGYSCGMSCINVKLMCRQDGLAGQFVRLAESYFQQSARPIRLGRGAYATAYLKANKVLKQYDYLPYGEAFFAKAIEANKYANNTLAKEGLMPKHYGFIKNEATGKYSAEQDALIGYVTLDNLPSEKLNKSAMPFIERILKAKQKYNFIHGDLHTGNIMAKLAEDGKTVLDLKLIDGDFAGDANLYLNPTDAMAQEAMALLQITEQ